MQNDEPDLFEPYPDHRAMGLVEPTGARRFNPSGRSASVLRLTDKGRAVL